MWKRLTVMSLLMVTVGCKPSVDKAAPAANAETVASTASAEMPSLRFLPELAKGIAAMPRVTGETPEVRAINADLERMDGQVRAALPQCGVADPAAGTSWERFMAAPMMGPRFITVTAVDDLYCGGNHPDNVRLTVSYDLLSGRQVNWATLLPPAFVQPLEKTTSAFDFEFTVSRSPRLLAWLRDKISRNVSAEDRTWWDDCKASYSDEARPALMISIDAEHEGLAIDPDLPHVAQACTSTEIMSVAELQGMGASPDLIAAIQTAHRDRNWRTDLGSGTP
jgi:hypothetical protein